MATHIELCDLKNPKEAKYIYAFMYGCKHIQGKKGKDPEVNYLHFKHSGTKEELIQAEKDLIEFYKLQVELKNKLEKELENPKNNIKNIKGKFKFLDVNHYLEIHHAN